MTLVKAFVRPDKVNAIKDALESGGITGITVTEVRGHGKQRGHAAVYRGQEYGIGLLPKAEIEVVVHDHLADTAIQIIMETARTGAIGDGRVFRIPMETSYHVRTGEQDLV